MTRSSRAGLPFERRQAPGYVDLLVNELSPYRMAFFASLLLLAISVPAVARAESPADFDIPRGHFFTQTNGFPLHTSLKGYSITDEDDIPFWKVFNNLGGVGVVGYPITARIDREGKILQLTQRAVLEYDPEQKKVRLLDVMDLLSQDGRDDWLSVAKHIPSPAASDSSTIGENAAAAVLKRLDQSLAIKQNYESNPRLPVLLGLPTSDLHEWDEYAVMRFQKGALQLWKVDKDWAHAGDVTMVNAGEVLNESGLFPADSLAPEEPPEMVTRRVMASSRGQEVLRGVATWYGASFQGLRMANGERFNMYNPATAASNSHPLGTWLLVTDLSTGNSVEVRVTDRGAFRYPIVVDLSWAAFEELADSDRGVLEVIVETIDKR